ncbi:hypothetical protein PV326_006586 [Microctonus aethiopoides]|nr:hypothetical protein PV326_006586 [Microctonus aethiopoides]
MSTVNYNQWTFIEILHQQPNCALSIIFPDIINGKIDTNNFLTASRETLKIIEKFGKVFAPIKYDMQNNIEKIMSKYLTDKEKHLTIQDLILSEKITGKKLVASDALLWLMRALKMIQLFLERIVENSEIGECTEDLVANIKDSYKDSLEPYHGWMAQQLFGLLARMVPTRSQLLLSLANNIPNNEDNTLRIMDNFTKKLKINLMVLQCFMHDNHLDINV